nr:ankyrin repeat domain-containing protein [Bacteroidales bacterium]
PLLYFACPDSLGDYTLEVKAKDLSIANTLIRAGADFEYTPSSSLGSFAFYIFDAIDHTEKFYNRFSEYPKDELFSIIKLMISDGLHVFQPLSYHSTYLDYVVMYGEYDDVVESALTINIDITIYPYWTIVKHNKCLEFENEIITKLDAAMCMTPDEFGNTALHIAAAVGNSIPIIKAILDLGADVNARNMEGVDVLHAYTFPSIIIWDEAINHIHDFSIAKMLIEAGAEANYADTIESFSLMSCVLIALEGDSDTRYNHFCNYSKDSLFNLLLLAVNHGFNILKPLKFEYPNVVQMARENEWGELIVFDTVFMVPEEYIPLHALFSYENMSSFEPIILQQIQEGKYIGIDEYGNSALHYAVSLSNSHPIIRALIDSKIDLNSKNNMGVDVLEAFTFPSLINWENNNPQKHDFSIAQMLIEAGAGVNIPDRPVYFPLMACVLGALSEQADNGFTDFYKYEADSLLNILLLAVNNGFNVFDPIILKFDKVEQHTAIDMYGEMVVYDSVVEIEKTYIPYEIITHFDVFSDFEKAILKQLKSTHPCDSFTSDQLTPLHIASGYGCSTKIVNLLIKKSCDVNSNDIDGNTPLHAAAMNPLGLPIVKMLISAKADAGVIDKNGHNPEQVARMAKNLESADFLKAQLDKK